MIHNNLPSLCIIVVEKFEAKLLVVDDLIDAFAEYHNRRILLK